MQNSILPPTPLHDPNAVVLPVKTETARSKEIGFIGALRGLAALLAAYFHTILFGVHGFQMTEGDLSLESFRSVFGVIGYLDLGKCAVAIFFIISGFLIPATLRKPNSALKSFIIHRLFRLYPAYWISIFVLIIAKLAFSLFPTASTTAILVNFTMLQKFVGQPDVNGVFWTLQIELIFYGLCATLFILKLLDRQQEAIGLSLIACLVGAALRYWTGRNLPVALVIALALMFWGDMLRNHLAGAVTQNRVLINALLICICLIPTCFLAYQSLGIRYLLSYWTAMGIYLIAFYARAAFEGRGIVRRILKFLGDISYSVYLLHAVVAVELARYLTAQGYNEMVSTIVPLALTVFMAFVVYRTVELPFIRLGKQLTDGGMSKA